MGIIVLVVLCGVAFLPAFKDGKVVAPMDIQESFLSPWADSNQCKTPNNHFVTDAVTQYLPYRMFAEKSYQEDGYLGWNPYEMGGVSIVGNTMALPDSWTTHLHRFFSFSVAWNLGLIFEFLIAGIGMFIFLFDRKLAWSACLFGAIAFMLNSQFIVWIYHRWTVGSFCWMPWVLWASSNLFTKDGVKKRHFCLPLFLSLAILGGSLQYISFVAIVCGCLVLGRSSLTKPCRLDWRYMVQWAVLFSLVLGTVAYALVPQVQGYLTNIEIGHARGALGYKGGIQQVLLNAVAIPAQFWPWLMGDPQTLDGSKLLQLGYMSIAYFGTVPMIFAMLGLFIKDLPKAAKWMIVFGLLIPLTPLVGPLYHRVQIVFILGGCWMAAEVLNYYFRNPPLRFYKYYAAGVGLIGLLLIGGAVLPVSLREKIEHEVVTQTLAKSSMMQFGSNQQWLTDRAIEWTSRFSILNDKTLLVYSLLVLGAVGLYLLRVKNPWNHLGSSLLVVAVGMELGVFMYGWVSYSDQDQIKPNHPAIEKLQEITQGTRVYQGTGNNGITSSFGPPNILSSYFVPTLDAYESIQYKSVFKTLNDVPLSDKYTLSNVGYSICPKSSRPYPGTEAWRKVDDLSDFFLYENPEAIPFVISNNHKEEVSEAKILEQLRVGKKVDLLRQTMNTLLMQIPEDSQSIRIGQNWHRGWRWRIQGEGKWRGVVKGLDGACWIPSGKIKGKIVEVAFFPRPSWAVWLSLLCATVVILFIWLVSRKLEKQPCGGDQLTRTS